MVFILSIPKMIPTIFISIQGGLEDVRKGCDMLFFRCNMFDLQWARLPTTLLWWLSFTRRESAKGLTRLSCRFETKRLTNHCLVKIFLHNYGFTLKQRGTFIGAGVVVGEIGPKLGFNSTDNGYLGFNKVRIPRDHMLMKHSQVLEV